MFCYSEEVVDNEECDSRSTLSTSQLRVDFSKKYRSRGRIKSRKVADLETVSQDVSLTVNGEEVTLPQLGRTKVLLIKLCCITFI